MVLTQTLTLIGLLQCGVSGREQSDK
jgi:hypothetical protein